MTYRNHFSNVPYTFDKNHFEEYYWNQSLPVCGIDEAGRGCLAGPVVAAAVILPRGVAPDFLKDSKIMSSKQREEAALWIKQNAVYGIGIVHHRFIDAHNILNASKEAMKRAFFNLSVMEKPQSALIDAIPLSLYFEASSPLTVHYFPHGEEKSSSIAAASIIAKVARDEIMTHINQSFPLYQFSAHKGYATEKHRAAIKSHEACLIHRTTYLTNDIIVEDDYAFQQTLF